MKLTVGTRGSKLSIVQTESLVQELVKRIPDIEVKIKVIKTIGDHMKNDPLTQIKEKGIFEKEIDLSIIRGEIDFAVHSMKDVPLEQPAGTTIVAVPKRMSPNDVLVSKTGLNLSDLPGGSTVGTGSPRRMAQLHRARPDLRVKSIRGNVDTRIEKLRQGLYDAVIVAEAGLQRLGIPNNRIERLNLEEFTPSPGQGALAVVAKADDRKLIDVLVNVNHPSSMAEVLSEKAFVQEMGGGCKIPLGAVARAHIDTLSLLTTILSPDGKEQIQLRRVGSIKTPEKLGAIIAGETRRLHGERIMSQWRRYYA